MFTFVLVLLAVVGLAAIGFGVYLLVGEVRTGPRSREELLVEVEALRALGEISGAAWQAERRMFLETLKHLRQR